jgi:hypothetical protein
MLKKERSNLHVHKSLIITISDKRMRVLLNLPGGFDGNPGPTKLFHGDESFMNVGIFGNNVRPKMESEPLRDKNMRRSLGQIFGSKSNVGFLMGRLMIHTVSYVLH